MTKSLITDKDTLTNLTTLTEALLSPSGEEINNPQGIAIPIGLNRPESLKSQIQRIMRVELSEQADKQNFETFEESQDFECSDSFEQERLQSQYEIMEDDIPITKDNPVDNPNPPPREGEEQLAPPNPESPTAPSASYEKTAEEKFNEAQKPLPLEPKP